MARRKALKMPICTQKNLKRSKDLNWRLGQLMKALIKALRTLETQKV